MQNPQISTDAQRYAKTIEVSKRIRWDIDRAVLRGRRFDFGKKFLPDGLSMVGRLPFLSADEKRRITRTIKGHMSVSGFAVSPKGDFFVRGYHNIAKGGEGMHGGSHGEIRSHGRGGNAIDPG